MKISSTSEIESRALEIKDLKCRKEKESQRVK